MIKSEFYQLTPDELRELIFFLNKKFRLTGRTISKITGLSKSRVYQILEEK